MNVEHAFAAAIPKNLNDEKKFNSGELYTGCKPALAGN